jgi:hypothetical protein
MNESGEGSKEQGMTPNCNGTSTVMQLGFPAFVGRIHFVRWNRYATILGMLGRLILLRHLEFQPDLGESIPRGLRFGDDLAGSDTS